MSTHARRKMTVDEFLIWAEGQEGRWELHNGVPYAISPERTGHIKAKVAVYLALLRAARKAGVPCHVLADGAGVRISRHVMHAPDALVYCGPELPNDAIEVPNPVILVEVASPSTRKYDGAVKLRDYFSLASVRHYLIVDPEGPPVIHPPPPGRRHDPPADRARGHPDAVGAGARTRRRGRCLPRRARWGAARRDALDHHAATAHSPMK